MSENLKMLIVDDEEDICTFSKEYFKKRNFDVYTALDGETAKTIVEQEKPSVAVLDIHLLGELSGIDILKQIKENLPECKCIMVTRDDSKEIVVKTKSIGVDAYLEKPITIQQLENTIDGLIN